MPLLEGEITDNELLTEVEALEVATNVQPGNTATKTTAAVTEPEQISVKSEPVITSQNLKPLSELRTVSTKTLLQSGMQIFTYDNFLVFLSQILLIIICRNDTS